MYYYFRDYNGGTKYEGDEKLTDKVVIVTGANTGIGKEVALDLAKREARVVMACRDMFKCETVSHDYLLIKNILFFIKDLKKKIISVFNFLQARKQIVLDTQNKYVYCRQCDLASQESIREFVKLFKKGMFK